jgi:hypothetical protein
MTVVDLNGITAQYLVDSGVAERMAPVRPDYQPGGKRFTDAEAMRWAIGDKLEISMCYDRRPQLETKRITIYLDSEGLDASTLRRLLDTEITYEGRSYTFNGVSSDAETEQDYGGEYIARWMEIWFTVK